MYIDSLIQLLPGNPFYQSLFFIGIISFISALVYIIATKVVINTLARMFSKTSTHLDDIIINNKIFHRLAYILPAMIFYNSAYAIPQFSILLQRVSLAAIVFIGIRVINGVFDAVEDVYEKTKYSNRINIKSYIQVAKLIANIFGLIIMASVLMDKNPTWLLSGIGAFAAVLIITFKDTILSLVASMQISSNDLFKVGDWVEAPKFGADGDVIDIALHTVKIQNWDKTISIIPTHKLIESTFKNWKGMSDSGGRRIKRSIFIDINSISICTRETLRSLKNIQIIQKYLEEKIIEVDKYNKENNIDTSQTLNGRQITNIGTFRAYIEAYLHNNNKIHKSMTFLVRQLDPTEKGVPIQIYVFCNDTNWINYEGIQSDIFDHLLAVIPQFGLKVFQNPTGSDFTNLSNKALNK